MPQRHIAKRSFHQNIHFGLPQMDSGLHIYIGVQSPASNLGILDPLFNREITSLLMGDLLIISYEQG